MNYILDDYTYNVIPSKKSCLVMLSSYNGERYIRAQIESILSQENVDVHIIIRDDGSVDNTLSTLYKIKKENNSKIEIISGNNLGICSSFRYLILNAPDSYDYYAFSDQDDIWDKDKLFSAISSLLDFCADFYSCASRLVNENLESFSSNTSYRNKYAFYMNTDNKVLSPGVQGCTMVISSMLMSTLKLTNYPTLYGHDTWIPIVSYYLYDCIYDTNTHMSYRQHDKSFTGNRAKKIKQTFIRCSSFIKGLGRYEKLANDILLRYWQQLSSHDKAFLTGLAYNKSLVEKIRYIHTFKPSKYRYLHTLIFRVYFVFFKNP